MIEADSWPFQTPRAALHSISNWYFPSVAPAVAPRLMVGWAQICYRSCNPQEIIKLREVSWNWSLVGGLNL